MKPQFYEVMTIMIQTSWGSDRNENMLRFG